MFEHPVITMKGVLHVLYQLLGLYLLLFESAIATSCMGTGTLDTTTNICYTFNIEPKTYSDATSTCASSGSQLVSVQTNNQQLLLQNILQSISQTSSAVWLGGRLQQTPNMASNYRWISDCVHCGRDGNANLAVAEQGCYHDNRALPDLPYQQSGFSANLTPALCIASCRNAGYSYAGVQNGNQCFCGNSYGQYGMIDTSVDSNSCTLSCVGDTSQYCGGTGLNSIYYVKSVVGSAMWGYAKPNDFGGYQTCGTLQKGVSYKIDDDNCGTTASDYICDIQTASCPTQLAGYYYSSSNDACYYISMGASLTWFAARQQCIIFGGDLLKMNSTTIWNDVKQYLTSNKYWIGLIGLVWYWPNGDDMLYANWYKSGQDNTQWKPNNPNNKCLMMDPSVGYTWADSDCSTIYPFFCQKDLSFTTAPTTTTPTTAMTSSMLSTTNPTTVATTTTTFPTTTTVTASPTTAETATTTASTAITTASTTISTASIMSGPVSVSVGQSSNTTTLLPKEKTITLPPESANNTGNVTSLPTASATSISTTTSSQPDVVGTPQTGQSTSTGAGLSTGYIVLIVLCVILFIILIVCIIACLCWRMKHSTRVDYRDKATLPTGSEYYDGTAKDTDKIVVA